MSDKYIDFNENKEEILKLRRVSELISEVKPYFLEQKRRAKTAKRSLKIACITLVLMFGIGAPILNEQYDIVNTIVYHNLSAQDMGFPTDEYGLIMVE